MDADAVDRIHQRLARTRGGTAAKAGAMRWAISLPEDVERDDAPVLSFNNELVIEDGRLAGIRCDARLDRYTPDQAGVVATFQSNLATALQREAVAFASFEEVTAFVVGQLGGQVDDGTLEIPAHGEDGEPVFVSDVPVAGEPWVSLAVAFTDEVDPAWLLEQNGLLTHIHFEAFEGDVSLATALPRAAVTAQRLVELVEDLLSFRERLLDELEGGDDVDDEDAG